MQDFLFILKSLMRLLSLFFVAGALLAERKNQYGKANNYLLWAIVFSIN